MTLQKASTLLWKIYVLQMDIAYWKWEEGRVKINVSVVLETLFFTLRSHMLRDLCPVSHSINFKSLNQRYQKKKKKF